MTYGRSIRKALAEFGVTREEWPELAQDRTAWRAVVRGDRPSLPTRRRAARPCADRFPVKGKSSHESPHAGRSLDFLNHEIPLNVPLNRPTTF